VQLIAARWINSEVGGLRVDLCRQATAGVISTVISGSCARIEQGLRGHTRDIHTGKYLTSVNVGGHIALSSDHFIAKTLSSDKTSSEISCQCIDIFWLNIVRLVVYVDVEKT
jgi:hypothetical protein